MTPAERQKRYRDRKARGAQLLRVAVVPAAIDIIQALGWLNAKDRNDPEAVADAFSEALEAWAANAATRHDVTRHCSSRGRTKPGFKPSKPAGEDRESADEL